MQYELCRPIKTNGTPCRAPSPHRRPLVLLPPPPPRPPQNLPPHSTRGYLVPGQHIELTALEDRESVQLALSCVINALATGRLETKRATALLHGLQLASNNAASLRTEPSAPVRTVEPSPEGLDLAEPRLVEEEPELNLTWDPVDEDDEEEEEDHEDEERNEWNKLLAGGEN